MRIGAEANIQAMRALSTDMAVRAHNLANVSTEGFRPSALGLETGPGGQGLRVSYIRRALRPGPLVLQDDKFVQGSGTDPARELVGIMLDQTAFAANAAMVRAWDQTVGLLVDLRA